MSFNPMMYKVWQKHHTMIHKRSPSKAENKTERANLNTETSTKPGVAQVLHVAIHSAQTSITCILLATAQVLISNGTKHIMKIRALIDQGSEVMLISESCTNVEVSSKKKRLFSWLE